jgi:hypothetical protein
LTDGGCDFWMGDGEARALGRKLNQVPLETGDFDIEESTTVFQSWSLKESSNIVRVVSLPFDSNLCRYSERL